MRGAINGHKGIVRYFKNSCNLVDNNPTKKTVTREVIKALERLIEYERDDELNKKLSS